MKVNKIEKRYMIEDLEVKQLEEKSTEKDNIIVGYALKFEKETVLYSRHNEEYREIVKTGALDNVSLDRVILLYDHNGLVLATTNNGTLKLEVDEIGLRIEARLNDTANQKEVYSLIDKGYISKMSFAFNTTDDGDEYSFEKEGEKEIITRTIKQFKRILDVSVVSIPAYEDTIVEARSILKEKSEERAREKAKEEKFNKEKAELEKYFKIKEIEDLLK